MMMKPKHSSRRGYRDIAPDEIFIDAQNLPDFDTTQFEGRLERPITGTTVIWLGVFLAFIGCIFISRFFYLEIENGAIYADKADKNHLDDKVVFAERGVVNDRNGVPLITNIPYVGTSTAASASATSSTSTAADLTDASREEGFSTRHYTELAGFGNILGYVKYPKKDKSGNYFTTDYTAIAGIESYFDSELNGVNGSKITETDVAGKVVSQSTLYPPVDGHTLTLSIDSRLQTELYNNIEGLAKQVGFHGGGAVVMDVTTGEIIALTTYPEYDPNIMAAGTDSPAISGYLNDTHNVFLNRVLDGVYTPGSIVKPIVAIGALNEHVITPDKQILSTGSISLPNPYDPSNPSVFYDWRPQGWVDMAHALAVSSDVYFYEVGGGFQDQKGLGIANIEKYYRMFGLGSSVPGVFSGGQKGTIPDPAWKAVNFPDDPTWRVGDTYFTAIGQYGVQVTPLQMVREAAAMATDGKLFTPTLLKTGANPFAGAYDTPQYTQIPLPASEFATIQEGMRDDVLLGTGTGLNVSYVDVSAKTGTAELGVSKANVNSWAIGYWPSEHPKYAFAVMMETGDRNNLLGGVYVLRQTFDWMEQHTPEYFAQ